MSGGNTQIYQMDLLFKLDHKNQLWLLLCTGLKIREKFKEDSVNKEVSSRARQRNTGSSEREESPTFKFLENPDIEDKNDIISSLKMNKGMMKQYISGKNTISERRKKQPFKITK